MSTQDDIELPAWPRPSETWQYWQRQGQAWRTEPEIDKQRQAFLNGLRNTVTDDGPFPFTVVTLSRADVEWLLATHEGGRGPVDWDDERQRKRSGLLLCNADLRGVDLSRLPLAKVYLGSAQLDKVDLTCTRLEEAFLYNAHMEGAKLNSARSRGASFMNAHLEGASMAGAELEEASFWETDLRGVDLSGASMDLRTSLTNVQLDAQIRVADVLWNGAPLTRVKWEQVPRLGDESKARQREGEDGKKKDYVRLWEYQAAARAYRQLSVVLRDQGLSEEAARFAYRAQLLQRVLWRYQRRWLKYIGSLFLGLLAGYGFKPWRSFLAYLIVISAFAATYYILGHTVGPVLSPLGAFVFSMTSFHGRGFFPGGIGLDDPLTVVAALEAFIGLLIEVTFIATLTQRLFGK